MRSQRPFLRIARHELKIVHADRSLWVVGLLLALLSAYATANGLVQTRARDAARAETLTQEATGNRELVQKLRRVMSGAEPPDIWSNPIDPSSVSRGLAPRYATVPTAPLAPLAIGQSDMYPDTYRITSKSRVDFMYDSEIENPWNLLMGRFDLAFLLTYLLPLFVFAWSYNCLAVEREQGTLRMLLSQPIGLRTVVAAKIAVRALVLLVACVFVPVVMMLATRPVGSGALLVFWLSLIAAYALFWFALSVLVDSFSRSSALSALVLISAWVLLVLVVPVALNLVVAQVRPTPSRAELATQTRLITIEGLNQLAERFGTEYKNIQDPKQLLPKNGRFEVPERLRAFALANQHLDERIETALDEFDEKLAEQQAFVDRFGVLSPAILVHEGMSAIAGSSTRRYQRFQGQVTELHAQWRRFFMPRIVEGLAITEADLAQLPKWTWREEDAGELLAQTCARWLQLLAASALMAAIAWWRLRRYPVL